MTVLHWAVDALGRGSDVYLFLIGMTALAAFARADGTFDWLAARARALAGRSRMRLFVLVYAIGILTTAFLSNDATIVVLTPAVLRLLDGYDANPLPYVFACALIANAASFVLPISNPSNLLVFAGHMPPLGAWLHAFALPSIAAIAVTFAVLWLLFRRSLAGEAAPSEVAGDGHPSAIGTLLLIASAIVLVVTSARQGPLGLTTFGCACAAWLVATLRAPRAGLTIVREIAWPVVALTAALFVIVGIEDAAGGLTVTRDLLTRAGELGTPGASLAAGFAAAIASNAINNLPVGLTAGEALPRLHDGPAVADAVLIGVNLGPNATVFGSLATILWTGIVRRGGIAVSGLAFARIGVACAVPALIAALVLLR